MGLTGREGMEPQPPDQEWDTTLLVERVRQGSPAGEEDLYNLVRSTAERYFRRQFGAQDSLDRIHDVFLIVLEAVRGSALRDARHLRGFVRTVVRYETFADIRRATLTRRHAMLPDLQRKFSDRRADPEQEYLWNESQTLLRKALDLLSPLDREILVRFYLQGQSKEYICAALNLNGTRFRLRKSRAKARVCELVQDLPPGFHGQPD
ncbi:MAG: sigma-70 family RNA polymerase sigma factor [Bryobacterales bacterium]|nr:sigma-70 family RNA polymerase sigma factor [Bryobacterales bacterium]